MSKKVRFAIVGTGVIAPLHAESIIKNPLTELVAVCDIIEEKAQAFADKYGVEHVYKYYEDMFKRGDIDVVCVCTPSGNHGEVTIAAAEAGIHVLCEKPIEITDEKLTAMIDACRKHGVKLGGIFQRRTLPAAIKTREAIQSGKLGKMVLGDAYLKYYRSPE
ncbi:MAG TPA: Gfo/Idh/MocA family oxidoreductase, partial [Bacillota bacterium]|nr:Gfo/Idh/MocA family oxidoreductase [Bacillota bacterium]